MTSPHLARPKPGLAFCILVPFAIWLIPAIIAVGLFVYGVMASEDTVDDFARIEVGQEADVELETGEYRVWAERDSSTETLFSSSVEVTIVAAAGGEPIVLESYGTSLTYDFGSRHGEAVSTFEIVEAGTYTVSVTSAAADVERVAIGTENPLATAGKYVVGGVVVGTIGFILAIIALIVFLVRRSRSKRRLASAATGFGSGGFGPGGYGPGPQAPPSGWGAPPGGYPPSGPSV